MAALVGYFLILLYILLKLTKRKTIARFIIFLYFVSSGISLYGVIAGYNEVDVDNIATLYYISCVLISLYPILKYANKDCTDFTYNEKFIKYFSYILIIFSFLKIYYALSDFSVIATSASSLSDVRSNYYQNGRDFLAPESSIEIIANLIVYISYLSPYFALYNLATGKKLIAILLLIASLCVPIDGLCIGEREASLKWLFNIFAAVLFFYPILSVEIKKKLKKGIIILLVPVIVYLVLMTIARFSDSILYSIYTYTGAMPENFSYLFYKVNPMLGGVLNFNFLIPNAPELNGPLNSFILSDRYLNVFGGMPGSLWLDFGYYTILYVISITFFMLFVMHKYNSKNTFIQLFLLIVQLQVVFMNIFYYDFTLKYGFYWVIILSAIIFIWTLRDKREKILQK